MFKLFNSSRVIAIGRVAMAISLLLLAVTDPGDIGFQVETDDLFALGYVICACAIAALAWHSWWLDYVLRPWFLFLDILVFVLLPSTVEPGLAGYRVAGLTALTFILLSAAVRWDWRIAGITALVLNILNLLISMSGPILPELLATSASAAEAPGDAIRNVYYFLIVSLLIVWVGSRIAPPRPPNFAMSHVSIGRPMLSDALAYVIAACDGRRAIVAWKAGFQGQTMLLESDDAGHVTDLDEKALPAEFEAAGKAVLFDFRHGKALSLDEDGTIVKSGFAKGPGAQSNSLHVRGPAIIAQIPSASGSGWILVEQRDKPNIDVMSLLSECARQLGTRFDGQYAMQSARSEAMARLRKTLARDLHDSVAQTIAGTRFWLQNLRMDFRDTEGLNESVDRIDEVLGNEAEHVRSIIGKLRLEDEEEHRLAGETIKDLLDSLSVQWRLNVAMVPDPPPQLPDWIEFELRQILREAVSNAARHGGARNVRVSMFANEHTLDLTIADDGKGFTESAAGQRPEMIAQRVDDLGGTVDVRSGGRETELVITLPIGISS